MIYNLLLMNIAFSYVLLMNTLMKQLISDFIADKVKVYRSIIIHGIRKTYLCILVSSNYIDSHSPSHTDHNPKQILYLQILSVYF